MTGPRGPGSMRAARVGTPAASWTKRIRVDRAATRATSSSRVEQLGAASTSNRAVLGWDWACARAGADAAADDSSAATTARAARSERNRSDANRAREKLRFRPALART
jgi:hypothetical protein